LSIIAECVTSLIFLFERTGATIKKGWLKEASLHMMPAVRTSKCTKALVIEDAKKYSSRGERQKAKGSAASVAIEKGWPEEATSHMHRVYSYGEMTVYKLFTQLDINFEVQKRFNQIRSTPFRLNPTRLPM
jgi:hypothetical protein